MQSKQPHPRSVRGLMARHGLSRTTVYAEIKRGLLEVTKIGSRTIVTEEQERAWLERNKATEVRPIKKQGA